MKRFLPAGVLFVVAGLLFWSAFLPVTAQTPPRAKGTADTPAPCTGSSAVLQPPFNVDYSCVSLGSVPGVPPNYGGLTLLYNNPNVLLIGGAANGPTGRIYQIAVVRGTNNHIVGFSGSATVYPAPDATVGQNNDGGVTFGPGDVLFVTRFSGNELEETKPGSTAPDKVVNLSTIPGGGVAASVGSVAFVPPGFPGAGQMKIVSYNSGIWYSAAVAPDANGTYDVTSVTAGPTVSGGPEGIGFVPLGSPVFPPQSVLIAEYVAGRVVTAPVDSNGDPVLSNAQNFITGLGGAEGTFIDPVTGDLLFSTFGSGSQIIRVIGFGAAPAPTAAVSRKTHGAAGPMDISLFGGGVESRNGAPSAKDHTVLVTFANPVTVGGALVTSTDNLATVDAPLVSSATVTVQLHNVSNAQRINLVLQNVNDGMRSGDVLIPMNVLIGDANGDGSVNSADATMTRNGSGQPTDATNFRADFNLDGRINSGDATIVRARSGTFLP